MGLITSAVIMGAGIASSAMGVMNKYNQASGMSKLAKAYGQSESEAIDRAARRLAKDQRFIKADALSGTSDSGVGQDQTMMVRAEMLNKMSEDLVELDAKSDAARRTGETQSGIYKGQKTAALISGIGNVGSQAFQGYGTMKDLNLDFGSFKNIGPSIWKSFTFQDLNPED